MLIAFRKLKGYRILRQFKRSYIPVREERLTKIKIDCFAALSQWCVDRKARKEKLQRYED